MLLLFIKDLNLNSRGDCNAIFNNIANVSRLLQSLFHVFFLVLSRQDYHLYLVRKPRLRGEDLLGSKTPPGFHQDDNYYSISGNVDKGGKREEPERVKEKGKDSDTFQIVR